MKIKTASVYISMIISSIISVSSQANSFTANPEATMQRSETTLTSKGTRKAQLNKLSVATDMTSPYLLETAYSYAPVMVPESKGSRGDRSKSYIHDKEYNSSITANGTSRGTR